MSTILDINVFIHTLEINFKINLQCKRITNDMGHVSKRIILLEYFSIHFYIPVTPC